MFTPTTPVQVLFSTCKKTGPRRGSIGLVESVNDAMFSRELHVLMGCARVRFIRYGFETKYRSEVKNVIYIIPTLYAFREWGKNINAMLEGLGQINFNLGRWRNAKDSTCNMWGLMSKHTHVVLMAPMTKPIKGLKTKDLVETTMTYLSNSAGHLLIDYLHGSKQTRELILKPFKDSDKKATAVNIEHVALMMDDREYRRKIIVEMDKDPATKSSIIIIMQYLKLLLCSRQQRTLNNQAKLIARKKKFSSIGGSIDYETLYHYIGRMLFVGDSFESFMTVYDRCTSLHKEKKFIKSMTDYHKKLMAAKPTEENTLTNIQEG